MVYSSDDIVGRVEKMRCPELSQRRGGAAALLSHQISMRSIGENVVAQQRAVSELSTGEENCRNVSESSDLSDAEEEGEESVGEGLSDDESSDDDDDDGEFSDDDSTDGVDSFDDWNVTSITVDWVSEDTSGEEAGRFVAGNARLKKLTIKGESMEWNDASNAPGWFHKLCAGVARNRSIACLAFRECGVTSQAAVASIGMLSPFVELNANLRRLEIVGCNMGDETTRLLASALWRRNDKSSLHQLILDANNIGDESGRELVGALHGYDNLAEISLGDNEIGQSACVGLSGLLSSPRTNLKELNIENNQVNKDGIAYLTSALANNSVLRELNLSFNCNITQAGWRTFATCLQNPNSALETLDISSTDIADEGAIALGHGLANNKTLKNLLCYDISADGMPLITYAGWQSVFACLRNKESALKRMDLRYSSIDEGGLSALTVALSRNSSLSMLDLSNNKQISAAGWRPFFACLENPRAALEEVRLCDNVVTNEDVAHLARSLRANNGRLKTVDLGDCPSVTDAGWDELSEVLCDATSAATIHSSNHALRSLGSPNVPENLDELLLLNSWGDERKVSREKILRYHFDNGRANMQEFADMEVNVLHHAVSWVGKNYRGRTLLYELLRSLPSLFVSANVVTVAGRKRKRV